jgi:hypothetical protein
MTTRSSMSLTGMQRPMRDGRARSFQAKPNGSSRRAAVLTAPSSLGAPHTLLLGEVDHRVGLPALDPAAAIGARARALYDAARSTGRFGQLYPAITLSFRNALLYSLGRRPRGAACSSRLPTQAKSGRQESGRRRVFQRPWSFLLACPARLPSRTSAPRPTWLRSPSERRSRDALSSLWRPLGTIR